MAWAVFGILSGIGAAGLFGFVALLWAFGNGWVGS